jgi:mannose-6-phosphate isomerase-like protein (cupin superfamily)
MGGMRAGGERATSLREPVVRGLEQVPARPLAPGVTESELLGDGQGCRGLHQRRLAFSGGGAVTGAAGGRGESWYVVGGSGTLDVETRRTVVLEPGTAVWMGPSLRYRCQARPGQRLDVLGVTVWAGSAGDQGGPALCVATLDACPAERTGDREFRVLLSPGLTITEFVGLIPPGRAPAHHHTYDEVVHVLAGRGVVHLDGTRAAIGPGTSVYLPPYQPHCLENTGRDQLQVLGVFHPAGSPADKQAAEPGC